MSTVRIQVDENALTEMAMVTFLDFREMQGRSEAWAMRQAIHVVLSSCLPKVAAQLAEQLGMQVNNSDYAPEEPGADEL